MRTVFDEAIGASPATTIDVDAVVTKGRRRVSLRRFAIAGAGTGVVAVAALALATFGRAAPGLQPPPDFHAGSAAPDGSAPAHPGETPAQTKQRLAAALEHGLTAALPGVRITNGPTGQPGVEI